jgi:hypothetical protein
MEITKKQAAARSFRETLPALFLYPGDDENQATKNPQTMPDHAGSRS